MWRRWRSCQTSSQILAWAALKLGWLAWAMAGLQSAVVATTPVVLRSRSANAYASPCTTLQPSGRTWERRPTSVRTPLCNLQATTATATILVRGSLVVPVASVPNTRPSPSMDWLPLHTPVLLSSRVLGERGGAVAYSAGGRPRTQRVSDGHFWLSFAQWGGMVEPRPCHHLQSSKTCRRSASHLHKGHCRLAPLAVV